MIVGVLGAGQLARMLALAAAPMGIRVRTIGPDPQACAVPFTEHVTAEIVDRSALERFAAGVDVVTFETESVPLESVLFVAESTLVRPGARAVEMLQDRVFEKELFDRLGIPAVEYRHVRSSAELEAASRDLGCPVVAKTRQGGYDGKGQRVIREPSEAGSAWNELGEGELLVEKYVKLVRELALMSVRSSSGQTLFYRAVESTPENGILRYAVVIEEPDVQAELESYAARILDDLDYVGALGLEFFETEAGILANEGAPRVHNTGHWTIEGASTSQFENHVRATLGLPLGSVRSFEHVAMVNYLGHVPPVERVLEIPGAYHHDYGKPPHPGRKLGHMTLVCEAHDELRRSLGEAIRLTTG